MQRPGAGGEIPGSPAFLFRGRGARPARLRMTGPVIPTDAAEPRGLRRYG